MSNKYLGFDNKYARPIPYVWFLILAVSSIPLVLSGTIVDSMPCESDYLLKGITPDEYFAKKHFTIDEAITECNSIQNIMTWFGKIFSGVIFFSMVWQFKPYPLSKPDEDESDESCVGRKTAI